MYFLDILVYNYAYEMKKAQFATLIFKSCNHCSLTNCGKSILL